jgi:hypothetical protein
MLLSDSFDVLPSGTVAFTSFATAAPRAPQPRRDENALAEVLQHPRVWRRGATAQSRVDALATGCAALDAELPGGGWPRGALSEILVEQDGIGEFGLVVPALAALTQARQRVVLIAPPYVPYAPALAEAGVDLKHLVQIDAGAVDAYWTAEQCLRAGCCGAVLNWLPAADYRQLRRLQLAAETGAALAFVFRPAGALTQASPAALRLRVSVDGDATAIDILKCRGRVGEASRLRA